MSIFSLLCDDDVIPEQSHLVNYTLVYNIITNGVEIQTLKCNFPTCPEDGT